MKVTQISYGRLINTGNYSHEKFDVTVNLEPGESPQDAMNKAKAFVEKQINAPTQRERDVYNRVETFDSDDIF